MRIAGRVLAPAAIWSLTGMLALAAELRAQDTLSLVTMQAAPADTGYRRALVPFGVGERAEYGVKYGPFSVGRSSTEVIGLDTIRGMEAWHVEFRVRGGVPGFRVNDRMESWMHTRSLASLRFVQDLHQGNRTRAVTYEIYPDSVFVQNQNEPLETVAQPLDEGAFFFFVRTIPLEVGQEYAFDRYFRPDRNPVRIQVLRKERINVPAGEFETIVVRPIFKSRGVFSEGGRAEVWLTDDSRRVMVQMKSQMTLGSLSLFLRSYTPARAVADTSSVSADSLSAPEARIDTLRIPR